MCKVISRLQACFADHVQTAKGVLLSYGCRPVAVSYVSES